MKSSTAPERLALSTFPRGAVPSEPSIALIVPILNESEHIDQLARDLRAQDYPRILEIWLVDGRSTDGTRPKLNRLAEEYARFRIADNPARLPAAAINLALSRSSCDVVMRLDAHAQYAPDMVRRSVQALLETGAGGVGTIARPAPGRTMMARAIVAAHNNPLGIAVASFRKTAARGWTDTVWNACYWKHVVDEAGPLREDIPRAEDNDYNARIRQLGYGLYLSPDIHAAYQPRRTLPALARQYRQNGEGVARAFFRQPGTFGLRHLAPFVLLAGLLAPTLAALLWPPAFYAAVAAISGYAAILIVAMLIAAHSEPVGLHILLLPVVLATLHLSYGIGELKGALAVLIRGLNMRSKAASDRSRSAGTHRSERIAALLPFAAALLAMLAWPVAEAGVQPQIWLVTGLERVGRDAQASTVRQLEIDAARGEWESFQLVIQAGTTDISQAQVTVSDLVGKDGGVIPKSAITLYREHYVPVPRPSPASGGPNESMGAGFYADALVPLADTGSSRTVASFSVKTGFDQPIWADIHVPDDAAAGIYSAVVMASLDGIPNIATITLRVRDFGLPLVPTLNSAFLVAKRNRDIELELLRNKLMPRDVHLADQQQLIAKWGLKSTNIGLWSKATIKHCEMAPAPAVEQVRASAGIHDPALRRYNYTADEIDDCPGLEDGMKAWARALHAAGIDNLVTMEPTPGLYDDGSASGRSAVDIWVMLPKMYERTRKRVAEVLAKGDEVWSYNALVQDGYSPKWQIDYAPINFRIQPGFISQSLGLTGLLYWQVDRWTGDAWNDVYTYRNEYGAFPGEGMLVYPGAPMGFSGVAPSMRLKWIRDGVEDFEYIALLKTLGCADLGLRLSREIGAGWRAWTHDAGFLERKRRSIADEIERVKRTGKCS